jgi:hypothetical protein
MNIVIGRSSKRRPTRLRERVEQAECRPRPPSDRLNFPSVWREEMRSVPDANVRGMKAYVNRKTEIRKSEQVVALACLSRWSSWG